MVIIHILSLSFPVLELEDPKPNGLERLSDPKPLGVF